MKFNLQYDRLQGVDPSLRENFVERVFAYARLRSLFSGHWKVGDLVGFHTAHKLLLMAHSQKAYQSLGRLVAEAKSLPRADPLVQISFPRSPRHGSGANLDSKSPQNHPQILLYGIWR